MNSISNCGLVLAEEQSYEDCKDCAGAFSSCNQSEIKFINLTPHSVTVIDTMGIKNTFEPEDEPARIEVVPVHYDDIGGFSLSSEQEIEIVGLPGLKANTIYIVSARVMLAAQRLDVVSPGKLMRDTEGKPMACHGFTSYPR